MDVHPFGRFWEAQRGEGSQCKNQKLEIDELSVKRLCAARMVASGSVQLPEVG